MLKCLKVIFGKVGNFWEALGIPFSRNSNLNSWVFVKLMKYGLLDKILCGIWKIQLIRKL